MAAPMKLLNYERTRWILLLAGLVLLGGIAAVMFARRVDPVEVAATLLFLPVFMAFLLFGIRGGLIGGVLAAAAYLALRYPAIQAVGLDRFVGLAATRTLGYLAFGAAGGWATSVLKASIHKLDLYDQIDSETGLHNSRYLIETLDLERSRAVRYEKVFSIVTIERTLAVEGKARVKLIKDIAGRIRSGARTVDQVVHATEDGTDIFSIVLPETGAEGARVFAGKLTAQLDGEDGAPGSWAASTVTFPTDEAGLTELIDRYRSILKADYPETASV